MRDLTPAAGARRRTRVLRSAALAAICGVVLSGCFLRSIVGWVDDGGGATLSGNVEVGFCDFDTSIPDVFFGCTYTITDDRGVPIDITSTFQLISEFGVFGLIIDPLILQVPADATNVVGTYNNAGSDEPLVLTETTTFSVTPGTTVSSEPGTKFLILELPDAVLAALPPTGADFDVSLAFDVADPANLIVKPMFTARVDQQGTRYYVPIFPCVTDFAQVPPVQIPVGTTFQDLRPAFSGLIAAGQQVACDQQVYDFRVGAPTTTTTTVAPTTTPAPATTTVVPTTVAPAPPTAAPSTVLPTGLPATGTTPAGAVWLAALAIGAGGILVALASRRRVDRLPHR